MEFLISRTRGLFQYGDIEGDTSSTRSQPREGSTMEERLDMETERSGIVSANATVRRRRRCIWVSSILCGLAAVIIITAAVKNRHHLAAAAEALVKSGRGAEGEMEGLWEDQGSDQSRRTRLDRPVSQLKIGQRSMSYDDFLRYKFYPTFFNGTWVSDTEILFRDRFGGLSIRDVSTSSTRTAVSHNQFLQIHPASYKFSADRKYLLVKTSNQRVWRRSSFGDYGLLRMGQNGRPASSAVIPLRPPNTSGDLEPTTAQYLRLVTWAPTGNALAYVDYNNNIHYRATAEGADEQVTTSGIDGQVYNGIPDWVSEEETFEDNKALWWSPDSSRLVYGVFDDTNVDVLQLPRYGSWSTAKTDRSGYPFLQNFLHDQFRYPKAGTTNPMVALMAANVGSSTRPLVQYPLSPPSSLDNRPAHFTSVTWADHSTVAVNWMNRVQNLSAVALCPLHDPTSQCREVLVLPERDGWVDYKFQPVFQPSQGDGKFLAILPAAALRYRPRQLFLIDTVAGSRSLLTREEGTEVTEVVKWTGDKVFYLATVPGDPGARQLHSLLLGSGQSQCLSCNTQEMLPKLRNRPKCQFISASMSKGGSYYMMDCHGPGLPYSCLHKTASNSLMEVWEANSRLESSYRMIDAPTVQWTEVAVAGTQQKAQVMLYLPPGYQSGSKLPMLVEVYGGPGFQKVDKQWQGYNWPSYVAGTLGIVYAVIDPRGSGFQGDAWRHAVYRQFGTVEVEDTISVTASLQKSLPYVDPERTAIWGWSYGGYLSLSALTQDTNSVFSCGASVAPVVRWELYDTVYTERYMSTPEDNPVGYNSSSPLWRLENLRDKQYYLIHGTHDDNVHYQQSMLLSAALEEKDILFRQQSYPDQDHSIGDYRRHLYHSLSNFFVKDCFKMGS